MESTNLGKQKLEPSFPRVMCVCVCVCPAIIGMTSSHGSAEGILGGSQGDS